MEASTRDEKGESLFLVPGFNVFFYLTFLPFKISYDVKTDRYVLQSFVLQQIFSAISHLITVIMFTVAIFSFAFEFRMGEHTIVKVLDFVSNLFVLLSSLLVINIFWRRQSQFLKVVDCTRLRFEHGRDSKLIRILINLSVGVCLIFLGVITYMITFDHIKLASSHNHNFNSSSSSLSSPFNDKDGIRENFLFGMYGCAMVIANSFYFFSQGIFVFIVLTLRALGKQVQNDLEFSWVQRDLRIGIESYRELKRKAEVIRKVYGDHLLAFYITCIAYYALAPHILLGKRGTGEMIILVYFAISGVVWLLAAEFHYTMRASLLKWIQVFSDSELLNGNERMQLLSISNEMSVDPIALSNKYFCTTYGHTSAMISLIFTYGILVFQLHQSNM